LLSFLLHLLIGGTLLIGTYRQDKRPVKEVGYWVVDLVPLVNAEPRSTEKGPSKTLLKNDRTEIARAPQKEPLVAKNLPQSEPLKAPAPVANIEAEQGDIPQTPPPAPVDPAWENSLKLMQDSLSNQIQAGQYRLVMKMPDQMMAARFFQFQKTVREQVAAQLRTSLTEEDMDRLLGKKAGVEISYSQDGNVEKVSYAQDSDPDLLALLQEKNDWNSLPSPTKYSFGSKALKLSIRINEQGKIHVGVELL